MAQDATREPKQVTYWTFGVGGSAPTPERLREQIDRAIKILQEAKTKITERPGTEEEWRSTPDGFPKDIHIEEWANGPDNNNWTEPPETFNAELGRSAVSIGPDHGKP